MYSLLNRFAFPQEATSKLEEAQLERAKAQEKARLWTTPIGLARPIQPEAKPWTTHRGEGAFVEADFHKLPMKENAKLSSSLEPEEPKNQESRDIASTKNITKDSTSGVDSEGNFQEKQKNYNEDKVKNVSEKVDDVSDIDVAGKQCERELGMENATSEDNLETTDSIQEKEHRATDITRREGEADDILERDHVMTDMDDKMIEGSLEKENIPKEHACEKSDTEIDEQEENDERNNKEAT